MRCSPALVPSLLIALLALSPSFALGGDEEDGEPDSTSLQPPKPEGPVRQHSGPRAQWTPERWLKEASYLEGELEIGSAVDALQTALRLGGGGQRHAYDLGRLLVDLLRGEEAREAFCLARLGPLEDWKRLAEERLEELGEKAPHWCDEGEDYDPYDWRRNLPATTRWTHERTPCDRALDGAWALRNAKSYVEAVAAFGEAEKVCSNKQRIELEVAYCLLSLQRLDAASVSLFVVTLGPDKRLADQAGRQLTVMPKPSDEERARREAEARRRLADEAKVEKKPQEKRAEGETGGSR